MTAKECYDVMGGNYDEILSRMGNDDRIVRFLGKFEKDPSYDLLLTSMEEKNIPEAFRAAHTMKGVCKNLAITKLADSASILADVLRDRDTYGEDIEAPLAQVKADYGMVLDNIHTLIGS
jgi:HPt (histidine-containing phosphotransfer) domain-containing protein